MAVSYESVRGTIRSSWRVEGDLLYVDVEIPVNTTATLQLPTREPTSFREGGRRVEDVASLRLLPAAGPGRVRVELGSGRYAFTVAAP